jgi:hypothetical protein
MHPQLIASLAAEHQRDLAAAIDRRAQLPPVRPARAPSAGASPARARRARLLTIPRLHVSWTRTRLAAISGRRRGSSLVIVISATRTS